MRPAINGVYRATRRMIVDDHVTLINRRFCDQTDRLWCATKSRIAMEQNDLDVLFLE